MSNIKENIHYHLLVQLLLNLPLHKITGLFRHKDKGENAMFDFLDYH